MKTSISILFAVAMSTMAVHAAETTATKPMDPKKEEMMKAWKEFATPGEPHKVLKEMAGEWKYTSKWWEAKDATAQESTGTSTMKLILGDRFLQHETKGEAMGMPFEGLGITGYDNVKKKYDTLWLDNMSTGIMHGMGKFDNNTQTLSDKGEYSCPISKKKSRAYRSEWKIVDKDNMTYTMYGPDERGREFKQMEMAFKRTK